MRQPYATNSEAQFVSKRSQGPVDSILMPFRNALFGKGQVRQFLHGECPFGLGGEGSDDSALNAARASAHTFSTSCGDW